MTAQSRAQSISREYYWEDVWSQVRSAVQECSAQAPSYAICWVGTLCAQADWVAFIMGVEDGDGEYRTNNALQGVWHCKCVMLALQMGAFFCTH